MRVFSIFLLVFAVLCKTSFCIRPYNQTTAIVLCDLVTAIPRLKLLPVPWSCPNASMTKTQSWCKPWTGISCSNNVLKKITSLTLSNRALVGTIPTSIGLLTSLNRYLWLFNNHLGGTIPSTLGNLTLLMSLRLDENSLTGNVPARLSRLTKLSTLNLNDNYLNGSLPSYFKTATYNDDGQNAQSSFNQLTYYPTGQPTGQPSSQPSSQPCKYANQFIVSNEISHQPQLFICFVVDHLFSSTTPPPPPPPDIRNKCFYPMLQAATGIFYSLIG